MEPTDASKGMEEGLSRNHRIRLALQLQELVHNMNNYLLTAGGTADLLKRKCQEQPDVIDRLERVQQSVKLISNLARQASGVLGQVREEKGEWALRGVVETVAADHPEWETATCLQIEETDGASQRVAFSFPHLCFTVEAVISNAFEANPKGATVVVSERVQLVESDSGLTKLPGLRDGVYAVLDITDQGPGVQLDDPETAFDPFTSTKDSSRGSGLFLARKFMQKNRGGLYLEPGLQGGTKALLYFPLSVG